MTWLMIDAAAIPRFLHRETKIVHTGGVIREARRYYVTKPADDALALVVCRNDLRLEDLAGLVVDAALGWDKGTAGYVFDESRLHSKITVYRVLPDLGRAERTLSSILEEAPRRKEG